MFYIISQISFDIKLRSFRYHIQKLNDGVHYNCTSLFFIQFFLFEILKECYRFVTIDGMNLFYIKIVGL